MSETHAPQPLTVTPATLDDLPAVQPAEPPAVVPAEVLLTVLPGRVCDLPAVLPVAPPRRRPTRVGFWGLVKWVLGGIASAWEWLFGAVTLIVGLAVLAALPGLQFLTLGYLLEAGGRVGRTGRLRDGFIGVRTAARVGSIVLGTWLMLLPLRLVSSLWLSAELVDPGGPYARGWHLALTALTVLMVVHIVIACSRGGRLRHFLFPFTNPVWLVCRLMRGGYYAEARDAVWDFVTALRLPHYFWLGLRGFAGGFLWLVLPISMIAAGRQAPALGFLGGLLLAGVLLYLPFLQMHFAAENRFAALFEVGAVRRKFKRAPWAFAFALFVTLLFALPLYLFKIEIVPREAAWLPSLVFLVFIFPSRLLAGWAYGRAGRRSRPRHWFFRWTGRLAMLPMALWYVLIVFFTQYTSWDGVWSLYEQHAFLLPVPFTGLR
jgi:hypothetical protein